VNSKCIIFCILSLCLCKDIRFCDILQQGSGFFANPLLSFSSKTSFFPRQDIRLRHIKYLFLAEKLFSSHKIRFYQADADLLSTIAGISCLGYLWFGAKTFFLEHFVIRVNIRIFAAEKQIK
jgi:hypothetical protein